MQNIQKRQIAYKISIGIILKGKYIKTEGWEPNYLLIGEEKISRINLIGIIIGIDHNGNYETLLVEDGTGKISVRSFEQKTSFSKLKIADAIQIIGRPREFNSEIYIIPEIIKLINNKKWIDVRLYELQKSPLSKFEVENIQEGNKEFDEMNVSEELIDEKVTNLERIYNLIKKLDKGPGADYKTVMEQAGEKARILIEKLLKEGEIFEIAPGKLKIL